MKYKDPNKERRERERRLLNSNGWKAVPALKTNGAFKWKWIRAGRKKAYSRSEAVRLTRLGRI